jgi:CheY-like chemotaxis protein
LCAAVVCEDDQVLAAALDALLAAQGFRVMALVDRGSDLVVAVREHDPAVVIVDAALLGAQGMGLLAQVRAESPATLVALCPPGLELPGLGADTDAVVPGDDLGPLRRVLAGLAAALWGGSGASATKRQGEHEGSAGVDEVTTVSSGDAASDGQAQPRSTLVVEAGEPLEDAVPVLRGHAGPVVGDLDPDRVVGDAHLEDDSLDGVASGVVE